MLNLSEQFWASLLIQVILGVALIAMMKQQLRDLVGWVRQLAADHKELRATHAADVKDLWAGHTGHEGRISHVEGILKIPRGRDEG